MSFKRDGNDSGLLSLLQKRRVKDLLAENIPEDEAKLLSNGRFACLVCFSHPVFDTLDMLSVHRKGKKHKSRAEIHESKKEELRILIAKRKHDHFVNTGSTSIDVAHSQHSGISTSSPYDSRTKRKKVKPTERKPRVNLNHNEDVNDSNSNTSTMKTFNSDQHSSSSSHWQRICEQQFHGLVKHKSQLKNIFRSKISDEETVQLHPYTQKHKRTHLISDKKNEFDSEGACSDGALKSELPCNSNIQITQDGLKEIEQPNRYSCFPPYSATTAPFSTSTVHLLPPPPPPPPSPPVTTNSSQPLNNDSSHSHVLKSTLTLAKSSLALKYHQLQGSGWKRDWDGKWIKDEQAEFDSDEEPPDLP